MLPKVLATLFAARFKEAREKKNVTIKALLPEVGASSSAMNGYATGKTLPPLDVACKIARELDVSLDWLCGLVIADTNEPVINTCADAAAVLDKIVDIFRDASISTTLIGDDGNNFEVPGCEAIYQYYTTLRIESQALYEYYQQLESTTEYLKNLPENMRADFIPYRDAMMKQLRKKLATPDNARSGFAIDCSIDELPF